MLIEFKCSNFRSFKGDACLSMLPVNAYKEHPDNMAPVRPAGTLLEFSALQLSMVPTLRARQTS